MSAVSGALELLSSLEPALACAGVRGWGRWEERVGEVCDACLTGEEGGEVRVDVVRVLREVIRNSSDAVLAQHCLGWKNVAVQALQCCHTVLALREVGRLVSELAARAHLSPAAVRDFPSQLPPLLVPLLSYQHSAPTLQTAVLPCVSSILHHFPGACKPHRATLLSWARAGLLHSDSALSQEACRLLLLLHYSSPDQWLQLLTSSLTALSSSLSLLYQPVISTAPAPDNLNFDLPQAEPQRSSSLFHLVTAHSRLLCHCLLLPPPSPLPTPLTTILGVVALGLSIRPEQVTGSGLEAAVLLSLLPSLHSTMWTLLTSLITSSHTHLLPFSSIIDACFLQSLEVCPPVGVVCVLSALGAWVRVRGEGGDRFTAAVVQWLVKCCKTSKDHESVSRALLALRDIVSCCGPTLEQQPAMLICQIALATSSSPSSPSSPPTTTLLISLKLLRACVGSSHQLLCPPLSLAVVIFQRHLHHFSSEVREECRHGLMACSLLQHPTLPPWTAVDRREQWTAMGERQGEEEGMRGEGGRGGEEGGGEEREEGEGGGGMREEEEEGRDTGEKEGGMEKEIEESWIAVDNGDWERREEGAGDGERREEGAGDGERWEEGRRSGGGGESDLVTSGDFEQEVRDKEVGPPGMEVEEEEGEEEEVGEEMGEEEEEESDIEDILATFCSSPASDSSP